MLLYLHNLSASSLIYNDIGLVINAGENFVIDTAKLDDFLRNGSLLKTAIEGGTYGTDLVVSSNSDPLIIADRFTATEAVAALTNGIASQVYFDNSTTNLTAETVQKAIEDLITLIEEGVEGISWRAPAVAISQDPRLNVGGTINVSGAWLPFSDDETPDNITAFVEGQYVLYKGASAIGADDKIYQVQGTNLVQLTGDEGLVAGYAYVVKNDLLESPDDNENAAFWIFTSAQGLVRLGSFNLNNITLQSAYNAGNTIDLVQGSPLVISDGVNGLIEAEMFAGGVSSVTLQGSGATGGVDISTSTGANINLESANDLIFKDQYLTNSVNLSESDADVFDSDSWNQSQIANGGVFDWSRPFSPSNPSSIMGGLFSLRDDLTEYVTILSTSPVATDVDANGSNLIGVKGITGVVPTGGADGDNASLQAMLEGLADGISGASYDFENGLTESSNVVKLGGILTEDTTIDVGAQLLQLGTEPGASTEPGILLSDSLLSIGHGETGYFEFYSGENTFRERRSAGDQRGIVYGGDYEADFVDRTLVTKQYVDGLISTAGGKTFSNIAAFTSAKSGATTTFTLGEVVYIQDINRFVEVLVIGTGIVEDTDWSYVGGENNAIGGSEVHYSTEVVFKNGTTSISTKEGATYYDTDLSTLVAYDGSRSKLLAIDKQLLQFGASNANGQYLTINGVQSGLTGFLIPRNATLTAISIMQSGGNNTKGFEIRVNGVAVGGAGSFSLVAGRHTNSSLNLNINSGDYVQIFAVSAGQQARNVVATVEFAYRK